MRKTTKGALAATAAAALLMGGAGTLAFWSDSENIAGGTISSGQLDLGTPACGSWKIDGGATFDPATQKLVPGDVLTKVCTIELTATGTHMSANLAIATPGWGTANNLTSQLTPGATFTVGGVGKSTITSADDTGANGNEISATITVTFTGSSATNTSQNLSATLNAVTVSANQTHA